MSTKALTQELMEDLKEFLKGPEFNLDEIFGVPTFLPDYNDVELGSWKLKHIDMMPSRGYFNGMRTMPTETIPLLSKNGETWMSVVPMECESHAPHVCRDATNALVFGLGLGYVAYNMIHNGLTAGVTVVEKDPEVIELFYQATNDREDWAEVLDCTQIIEGDAFTVDLPDVTWDHVYVDIWPVLFTEQAVADVTRICERLETRSVSWWGMEADFISYCAAQDFDPDTLSGDDWFDWQEELGLQLDFDDGFDYDLYVRMAKAAVHSQAMR